jgi:RHS repeat-associated protein
MGGGVGGLLYSSRSTLNSQPSTLRYNLSNGRGDIVAQSDAYAALTWTASYEAYGKRTKETGENKDKQRGNSKDEDPTGLLNEGFRYRDIETGVWLSRDPAGFVDGPNLYAYVKCNPWSKFDALGLYEEDFHYYAVNHVLLAKGHDRASAHRMAGFSQYVDDSPTTEPLGNAMNPVKNYYHHFIGCNRVKGVQRDNPQAQQKLSNAFKAQESGSKDGAYLVGDALHTMADTFAHEGFSSFWVSQVNVREGGARPNIGHADAPEGGHAPDRPYNDVNKAIAAAKAIYDQSPSSTAKGTQQIAWDQIEKDLRQAFTDIGASLEDRITKMKSATNERFGFEPHYDSKEFAKEEGDFSKTMVREENKLYGSREKRAAAAKKKETE